VLQLACAIAPLLALAAGSSPLKVTVVDATVTFGPGRQANPDDPKSKFQPTLEARLEFQGKPSQTGALTLKFHLVKGTQRRPLKSNQPALKVPTEGLPETLEIPWPGDLRSAEGWRLEVEVLGAKQVLARASRPVTERRLP